MRKNLNLPFKKKKKKANVAIDLITILILILCFVFFTFFGKYIFDDLNSDMQADNDLHNLTKDTVNDYHSRYTTFFDYFFLFFFFGMWCLGIFSAFKVDTHPIFFIFTVILLILTFIIAAYLGNVYEETFADDDLNDIPLGFPIINWIMSNLLIAAIVIGFSIVLVLFGKNRYGL